MTDTNGQPFPSVGIDVRQCVEPLAVEKGVGNEIHGPDLEPPLDRQPFQTTRRRHVMARPPGPQVQPFFPVLPLDPLVVDQPASRRSRKWIRR